MAGLAGLGVGGAVGGFTGALIGMGIPEYEAKRYEGRIKDGGILLSVHCDTSEEITRAKELMKSAGADDISSTGESSSDSKANTRGCDFEPLALAQYLEANRICARSRSGFFFLCAFELGLAPWRRTQHYRRSHSVSASKGKVRRGLRANHLDYSGRTKTSASANRSAPRSNPQYRFSPYRIPSPRSPAHTASSRKTTISTPSTDCKRPLSSSESLSEKAAVLPSRAISLVRKFRTAVLGASAGFWFQSILTSSSTG